MYVSCDFSHLLSGGLFYLLLMLLSTLRIDRLLFFYFLSFIVVMSSLRILPLVLLLVLISGCSMTNPLTSGATPAEEFTLTLPEYTAPVESDPITVNGQSVNLASRRLKQGDTLVDVTLDKPAATFDTVSGTKLSDLSGYTLIYTVPSLDTPVCTRQTKEIEAASKLFPHVNLVVISEDTPFALKRFCGDKNIHNVHTLSDARTREFGTKNGFLLTDYSLLTRAITIVDDKLNVVYVDYVEEVTSEADLPNAFAYLKTLGLMKE